MIVLTISRIFESLFDVLELWGDRRRQAKRRKEAKRG